jgi:transposase
MRKHNYRSIDVKKIDRENLSMMVEGEDIVIGVDIAKEDMHSVLVDTRHQVKLTIKWKHPSETRYFVELVSGLPARKLEAAMEPSGTYGDSLRYQFLEAGLDVFRVSPKRCHDAAEVYDGVPSYHDAKSAAIIAKLHLDGASEPWPFRPEHQRGLTAAISVMDLYEDQFHRNLNRLEALLARHWPELTEHLSLDKATLLVLLSKFGSPGKVAEHMDKARTLMRKVGGYLLAQDKIELVLKSAQDTVGVPLIEEERKALKELAEEARRAQTEAGKAKRKVEKLSCQEPAVTNMSQVVGKATAAVLVSSAGDPGSHSCASSYVKSLGLNLKERSSGKHKGQLKITKRGPSDVRRYLYLAVLRLIQEDAVFKAWYIRKVKRDGGMKMKAIIALMRKLAKALWHVSQGKTFDSSLLFNVHRLSLAAA